MSDYTVYKEKAREKITQYGNPIKLIQDKEPVYNPELNEYVNDSVIVEGVALQSSYSMNFIDGVNIKMGDIKLMTVIDIRPLVNDTLEYKGKIYKVISVSELNPNGEDPIYYNIQAR